MSAKPCSLPAIKRSTVLKKDVTVNVPLKPLLTKHRANTAIVYCEGNFAALDGKTANGLVRSSEKYRILSVIDSEKAGLDTGMVLDEKKQWYPPVSRSC